jgi:hypothetical protein
VLDDSYNRTTCVKNDKMEGHVSCKYVCFYTKKISDYIDNAFTELYENTRFRSLYGFVMIILGGIGTDQFHYEVEDFYDLNATVSLLYMHGYLNSASNTYFPLSFLQNAEDEMIEEVCKFYKRAIKFYENVCWSTNKNSNAVHHFADQRWKCARNLFRQVVNYLDIKDKKNELGTLDAQQRLLFDLAREAWYREAPGAPLDVPYQPYMLKYKVKTCPI